jgi:hypothetical protein
VNPLEATRASHIVALPSSNVKSGFRPDVAAVQATQGPILSLETEHHSTVLLQE